MRSGNGGRPGRSKVVMFGGEGVATGVKNPRVIHSGSATGVANCAAREGLDGAPP